MTRKVLFSNNAVSTLAGNITSTSTSLTVQSGDGAKFPTLTSGKYFLATLVKSTGQTEIVKVTAKSTDTFTIERAAEPVAGSSVSYAYSIGDRIEHRLTAGALSGELDRLDQAIHINTSNKSANYTVVEADITSLLRVNTASGNLTITLPQISTLSGPFDVIVSKVSADLNTVTIIRSGSDTINGAQTYVLTSQWQGAWITSDASTNTWTVIASGSGGVKANVDAFTGNGTTGPFVLSGDPGLKENTEVYVGGVYQQKSTYTLSGVNLLLGGTVAAGVPIEVVWHQPMEVNGSGTMRTERFTGDGSTVTFTLANTPGTRDNTQVYIEGIYQQKDTYTLSGRVLTLSAAPDTGYVIEVVTVSLFSIAQTDSAFATFLQAGTGAVTRTMQDKGREIVTVEDFGAVGDGTTDDHAALQAAFTWSKVNTKSVFLLDKRYYTSASLDISGAVIRSVSGKPGWADPYYLMKPDGTPAVGGTPNGDYYFNRNSTGVAYTFAQMVAATASGCAIVSDYNGSILYVTDGYIIDIDGIAIVGYHRATNQAGIATTTPTSYKGANQQIKNINIIGCGHSGINLPRGLENSQLERVTVIYCNGHGMIVSQTAGVDSPTDNIKFLNCNFQFNRLAGLYISAMRKHLYFRWCDFSGNGQYQDGQQPGGSWIDPLLGYDRQPPTNVALMAAGVKIGDVDASNGGYIFNIDAQDCQGELMGVGFHIRARQDIGSVQYLHVNNVSFYRDPKFPYSGGNNAACFFFDVDRLENSSFNQIYPQSCDYIKFASDIVPIGSNSCLFFDNAYVPLNATHQSFATFEFPTPIRSKAPVFAAYRNSTQVGLASGVGTKIVFNAEDFDSDSCFDPSLGRFTPTVAGWYRVSARITFDAAYTAGYVLPYIAKNGSGVFEGDPSTGTSSYSRPDVNALVYCNGTTDYLEIYLFQNSGGTLNVYGAAFGARTTYFQGELVRAS